MEFTKIIVHSYQTEKSYALQNAENPKYAFVVDPKANKTAISIAFQSIYGHKPVSITTQLKKPTHVRTGTTKPGFSKLTKIAYITLKKGVKLSADDTEDTQVGATANETKANENVAKKEVKASAKKTTTSKAVKKEVKAEKAEVKTK
jgi:ribosomal protein L23